jgi:Holliday junction resolvasome RuvABC endonuclease subunit
MSIYVGIDPSLTQTGVCVLFTRGIEKLKVFRTPRAMRGAARLVNIRDNIQKMVEPYRSNVTLAAVEGPSLGSTNRADDLGQLRGVVLVLLMDLCIEPILVAPASLKMFVAAKGDATKEEMASATARIWDVTIPQHDACDAHGLARFAEEYHEGRSNLRHQIQAVYNLKRSKTRSKLPKIDINNL